MSTKWAAAILILIVILIGWWAVIYYTPAQQSAPQVVQQQPEQRIPSTDTHYTAPQTLDVHHTVVNGANVYAGTLPIRSCNTFSGGLSTSGSNPVHVALNFKIFDGDGTCLTATTTEDTPQPFTMSFSSKAASSAKPVLDSVTINDATVPFKVIEGK